MAAIQLMNPDQATFSSINKLYHDGIELEKGVGLIYLINKNSSHN